MMRIFRLKSDVGAFSSFIEKYPAGQESIIGRSMAQEWKPFDDSFRAVELVLRASDDGKKNYQFDISGALGPFFVFSEQAVEVLSEKFLGKYGQFLPVMTPSKKKKFLGYYPNNPVADCLDLERSQYRTYEYGLVIEKAVLVRSQLPDRDVFVINEDMKRVFVTERFKEEVESSGLKGFDFSNEIDVS